LELTLAPQRRHGSQTLAFSSSDVWLWLWYAGHLSKLDVWVRLGAWSRLIPINLTLINI
jgi:hypothetical protein